MAGLIVFGRGRVALMVNIYIVQMKRVCVCVCVCVCEGKKTGVHSYV